MSSKKRDNDNTDKGVNPLKYQMNVSTIAFLRLFSVILFLTPNPVTAAEEIEPREPASTTEAVPQSVRESKEEEDGIFGTWGGRKSAWREAGYDFKVSYKGDATRNLAGGLERKGTFLGNLDLRLDADLEKIAGLSGLSLFVYGLGNHGGRPTDFVGDSFATSNIQAPNTFKLYEIYFKQKIGEGFSLLLGSRDLNADYNSLPSAGGLLNSAFGISPVFSQTGPNGPSIFPNTALALNLKYESPSFYYVQAGLFNALAGNPDQPKGTYINTKDDEGTLAVFEAGFFQGDAEDVFKYGLGAWRYSKKEASLDPAEEERHNQGLYVILDHSFGNGLSLFLKHGTATEGVNVYKAAVEAGLVKKGLFPSRAEDVLSLGYAQVESSEAVRSLAGAAAGENVWELSYSFLVRKGLRLTPDFQFVSNPGLSEETESAQVGTIRIEVGF